MDSSEIINGAIVGLFGGIFAGTGIWVLDRVRENHLFNRDEKRILKFFDDEKNSKFDRRTTHRIASDVNLTEERVYFVCSNSKKITRNKLNKETWELS